MSLLLGVDTGGTYTDAVVVRDGLIAASAKSLTTRHDLSIGISNSIRSVLDLGSIDPSKIGMASLSTTLATNALVEGHGERAGLVYVGFREQDIHSHGLGAALAGDPAIVMQGGHDHTGMEEKSLDIKMLEKWLAMDNGVAAYAVAGRFATRNPEHELAVAEAIRGATGKPVSCSHHLSAKLNGPKRALTALLNARLIGMIARLIGKAEETLEELGIHAPMMVVRGDGALVGSVQAAERPIETILSGPAASIIGAHWMTGARNALVSDIGGTTTDVALLRNGTPQIDPLGARVGPWRTMVEAVAMRTTGLGGDSEVRIIEEGLYGDIKLGPRRTVPISLLAMEAPAEVHAALDRQLRSDTPGEYDARFVRAVPGMNVAGIGSKEMAILSRIGSDTVSAESVLRTRMDGVVLKKLVNRGLAQIAYATPSDASHVLGSLDNWDGHAAAKALELLSRKRTGAGMRISEGPVEFAERITSQLTHQTALALLEAAFAEEETDFGDSPSALAEHVLMQRGLQGHKGLVKLNSGLNVPVVGVGASAPCYYPAIGERLSCEMLLPENAGVANAIGAVVGQVSFRKTGMVTSPAEGCFRAHLEDGPVDFRDMKKAITTLEDALGTKARKEAELAGAIEIALKATCDIKKANTGTKEVFLEAEIAVEARGRPGIAISDRKQANFR